MQDVQMHTELQMHTDWLASQKNRGPKGAKNVEISYDTSYNVLSGCDTINIWSVTN